MKVDVIGAISDRDVCIALPTRDKTAVEVLCAGQKSLDDHFANQAGMNQPEAAPTKAKRKPVPPADLAFSRAMVIAGGDSMSALALAKETPTGTVSFEERIRRRAYELYVECGNQSGSEPGDWFQAEEEVRKAEDEAIDISPWQGDRDALSTYSTPMS